MLRHPPICSLALILVFPPSSWCRKRVRAALRFSAAQGELRCAASCTPTLQWRGPTDISLLHEGNVACGWSVAIATVLGFFVWDCWVGTCIHCAMGSSSSDGAGAGAGACFLSQLAIVTAVPHPSFLGATLPRLVFWATGRDQAWVLWLRAWRQSAAGLCHIWYFHTI